VARVRVQYVSVLRKRAGFMFPLNLSGTCGRRGGMRAHQGCAAAGVDTIELAWPRGKVAPLPTLPTPYMETRASPRVPADGLAAGVPKPPNRVVLYGKVNVDPARGFGEREKHMPRKETGFHTTRGPLVSDGVMERGVFKDSWTRQAALLPNHGAHTHRPSQGATQLPAVRQCTASAGLLLGKAEGRGKERRLPEVDVQVKVPPTDAHKSPFAAKAIYVRKPAAKKELLRKRPMGKYFELLEEKISAAEHKKVRV